MGKRQFRFAVKFEWKNEPEAPGIRVGWNPFIHHCCCPVAKWTINNIRMPGNPSALGEMPLFSKICSFSLPSFQK